MLSDNAILNRMAMGDIDIYPFNRNQLNPNSYNLTLGTELLVYEDAVLDPRKVNKTRKIIIPPEGIVLTPGELYIGTTEETTFTQNLVPMLDGRSSVGRLGLFVHVTAGFGDVGFRGKWTLEIVAVKPVIVRPGMEICQISYHPIEGEVGQTYAGKYQGQAEPVASRMYLDKEKE